jgi:hypothetical protein
MSGLAARPDQECPETAEEILTGIRASLRRIQMAAVRRDDGAMLAAALRATEAAEAAERLTAREIAIGQIRQDSYARARTDLVMEIAANRRHLRQVRASGR